MSHTHHEGPACEGCSHDSCQELTFEECQACVDEVLQELAEYARHRSFLEQHFFSRYLCPIDATEMHPVALISAPGKGVAWECRCNHPWIYSDGSFYDPREYVPQLQLWEVR